MNFFGPLKADFAVHMCLSVFIFITGTTLFRRRLWLEDTLDRIAVQGATGRRYADKLVKVSELTGQEAWVLVHLEIQGQEDSDLAKRMLVYHYRIFDRYQKRIASLALLADKNKEWRPQEYCHELWDCELNFRFPMVKLLDFASRVENLENSQNPFAIAAFAHLKTMETVGNDAKRLEFKTYAGGHCIRQNLIVKPSWNFSGFLTG